MKSRKLSDPIISKSINPTNKIKQPSLGGQESQSHSSSLYAWYRKQDRNILASAKPDLRTSRSSSSKKSANTKSATSGSTSASTSTKNTTEKEKDAIEGLSSTSTLVNESNSDSSNGSSSGGEESGVVLVPRKHTPCYLLRSYVKKLADSESVNIGLGSIKYHQT